MILIVTHEVELGENLTRWLEERHYQSTFLQEGDQALQMVNQASPALIVVDVYLQNPSGMEFLGRLRETGYKGKVILLSGLSESTKVPHALHLGVDQVLGRPLSVGQVGEAIRSVIDPRRLSENLA